MSNYKLILWINQSNGDTLGAIPLIEAIKNQYPSVELKFACYKEQAYLLQHLPVEIVPIDGDYKNMYLRSMPNYFLTRMKSSIDEGFVPIHLWLGLYAFKHTWQNQVKTFNNQCKEKNIDISIDDTKFGFIELPHLDIEVKDKAIYVENSETVSGQTNFYFDLYKFSLMFPKLNFYTVGSVNFKSKNVFDCSKMSLIELSNVSRKCKVILGKGSGPFFSTLCEENSNKTKALVGLKEAWKYKFWNENDDNTFLIDSEKQVIEILRGINKNL